MRNKFLSIAIIFFTTLGFAQQKIELIHASILQTSEKYGSEIQYLKGQVILAHDSSTIFCDSAVFNTKENNFLAYNSVRIVTIKGKDTVLMFSDSLFYLGDSSYAFAYGNIRLIKDSITLYTDSLKYDFNADEAKYDGGAVIVTPSDTLVSKYGIYATKRKEFIFKQNVRLTGKNYKILSDTLIHNLKEKKSYFFGPTHIYTDTNYIYCEKGSYDHRNKIAYVGAGAMVQLKKQTIFADEIEFNRSTGIGEAFNKVRVIDTNNRFVITGQYGKFFEKIEKFIVGGDATLMQYNKKGDTMWLRSDTLISFIDTTYDQTDTFTFRKVLAYYKVKTYQKQLQSKCDSMVYVNLDSTIYLYGNPVMWSDSFQIYGLTSVLSTYKGEPYQLVVSGQAYIAEHTLEDNFNQISGDKIIITFEHKQIKQVQIINNANAIYHIFEDSTLIGINTLHCDTIIIYFKNKKVHSLLAIGQPNGKILPPDKATPEERQLPGFQWFSQFRPLKPEDIYVWKR